MTRQASRYSGNSYGGYSMDDYSSAGSSSPSYYVYPQGKSGMNNSRYGGYGSRRHAQNAGFYDATMNESSSVAGAASGPMAFSTIGRGNPCGAMSAGSYYSGAGIQQEISGYQGAGGGYSYGSSFNERSRYAGSSGVIDCQMTGSQMNASGDMYGMRRKGRFRRQAIRLPDAPPVTQQCRRRLPTPEPDILERVYIRRIPCKIIEEVIEEPMTPPPKVVERFINQPPRQNRYIRRVIKVPPRSGFPMYEGSGAYSGGQGVFGGGYAPGYGVGPTGGASYGYMDSSASMHGSYSSMPQVPSMPSMDYGTGPMSHSSFYDQGLGNYGMQVGSNVQSSFINPPMMPTYGGGPGPVLPPPPSSGTTYDCYPISSGGMMGGGIGGGNEFQTSGRYPPMGVSIGGAQGQGLSYYAGTPPNLICSMVPSGNASCPVNLCCYPSGGGISQIIPSAPAPMPMPQPPIHIPMPIPLSSQPIQMPTTAISAPAIQMPANFDYEPQSGGYGQTIIAPAVSSLGNYGQGAFGAGLASGAGGAGSMQYYGGTYPSSSSMMWGGSGGLQGLSSGSGLQFYGSGSSSGFFPGAAGGIGQVGYDFGGGMYPSVGGSYPVASGSFPGTGSMECGRVFRQIIALPEPPPEPIYNRQRLPTPPPDIYERILVCRPPRKVMYNILEQPTCPPPVVRNQYVMGSAQPPSVMNQVMHVPPKSAGIGVGLPGGGFPGIGGGFPSIGGGPCGGGEVSGGGSAVVCYPLQCGGGGQSYCQQPCSAPCSGSCLNMYGGGCSSGMVASCFPCDEYGNDLSYLYGLGGFPGMGFPGMGYPGMGYPGMGYPGMGYPGMGYPGMGYPGMGYPGMGYPGMGYPGIGMPGMGYPGIGGIPTPYGGGLPGLGGLPSYGGYY